MEIVNTKFKARVGSSLPLSGYLTISVSTPRYNHISLYSMTYLVGVDRGILLYELDFQNLCPYMVIIRQTRKIVVRMI